MKLFWQLWGVFLICLGIPLIILCWTLKLPFLGMFNVVVFSIGLYSCWKMIESQGD